MVENMANLKMITVKYSRGAGWTFFILVIFAVFLAGCNVATQLPSPTSTPLPTPSPGESLTPTQIPPTTTIQATIPPPEVSSTPTQADTSPTPSLRFAVIGDYGSGNQDEADVAGLVKSWEPEFIITTGDNNYPDGEANTIDENIGRFFHEFISPYVGSYGEGANENRFFPSLGNHDWHTPGVQPYMDYFTLPGNERYYDFTWGPVHFFAVDSDSEEPDGVDSDSIQADWLRSSLSASDSNWQIVYMHHPPYSSGKHGPKERMQWPFAEWGADVVLSGHDHTYERILRDGIVYFVNGLGGKSKYDFIEIVEGSQVRYNDDYGAMLVEVIEDVIRFKFIDCQGSLIDEFGLTSP